MGSESLNCHAERTSGSLGVGEGTPWTIVPAFRTDGGTGLEASHDFITSTSFPN